MRISGNLLKWLRSFLTGRTAQVSGESRLNPPPVAPKKIPIPKDLDPLPEDSALGAHYNPNDDCFRIKLLPPRPATTKPEILRTIAGLTEVVGWLAPTTMIARCLLQDIWTSGTGWDEEVHEDILKLWLGWEDDLPAVESLRFPRLLVPAGT